MKEVKMSHMSQQDIKEHNEAMAEKPNWCVNCHATVPDDIHFCCVECREEYDKKMDKWRQEQPRDLAIEDLINDKDSGNN
jgi:predicted nucleic acid-binding Zn ribbon protein